jgi:hypothetical protein
VSARANWTATVIGTAAGVGGWIFGLGHIVWPAHPNWALFIITFAATVATHVAVEREARRNAGHAQSE